MKTILYSISNDGKVAVYRTAIDIDYCNDGLVAVAKKLGAQVVDPCNAVGKDFVLKIKEFDPAACSDDLEGVVLD